jgi:hypothetical protein
MKRTIPEFIPTGGQIVRVYIPRGRATDTDRLMVDGKQIPFRRTSGAVGCEVSAIAVYEVIALE